MGYICLPDIDCVDCFLKVLRKANLLIPKQTMEEAKLYAEYLAYSNQMVAQFYTELDQYYYLDVYEMQIEDHIFYWIDK